MVGCDLALLEQRRHQTVGNAAVRGAFAHAVNARIGHGLHGVGHHNALVHMQAHALGQRRVGANAHGHHDQVGRNFRAVLELDSLHAAALALAFAPNQFLRLCTHQKVQAALFQRLSQQAAGHAVQLALHQRGHDVHDGHGHAAQHQAVGGF